MEPRIIRIKQINTDFFIRENLSDPSNPWFYLERMMEILGLDHVQLAMPVGGEAAARPFYENLLGLNEISKPEPLRPRGGCWFAGNGVQIHLGVTPDFVPARKAHPAFVVSDLAGLRQKLTEAGVAVVADTAVPHVHRFYASDPFGNRLEFIQNGDGFNQ